MSREPRWDAVEVRQFLYGVVVIGAAVVGLAVIL